MIMGFLLHELIPLEFSARYPKIWSKEKQAHDKDLVYVPNNTFSIEIKTSSNPNNIFSNRSYAQKVVKGKKNKSGYYLAVNFEKCDDDVCPKPRIVKIRFGWLDHGDWIGQTATSGQQARLSPAVKKFKLFEIYSAK
ncbi:MAG: NmeSIR protein [Parcubacteria group bacterium GW2011_GWA2_42_28]|nr:MAG: NmeSIR protein [Parcubacteria group bacterium GW2011_GWA2_42_28]